MNRILKKITTLDKKVKKNFGNENFSISDNVDQVFKWLPDFYVIICGCMGMRSKNPFVRRVLIIAFAELILNSIIEPSKKFVKRQRPDSFFKYNSFPSRHTATSFCGAEILYNEIEEHSVLVRFAGYTIATATAGLRLYRKKHWLSDIFAGAVVGVISAKLACWAFKIVID